MSRGVFQEYTSHAKMTIDDKATLYCLLCAFIYLILDTVLSAGHTVMNRIIEVVPSQSLLHPGVFNAVHHLPLGTMRGQNYYPRFTDEKTEAQRGWVTCLGPTAKEFGETGI